MILQTKLKVKCAVKKVMTIVVPTDMYRIITVG